MPESVALTGVGLTPTPSPTPVPPAPSITVTSSPLIAGHVASVEGRHFPPIGLFLIDIRSTPVQVASVQADEIGSFSTTFTIPATTTAGTHTLEVRRSGSSTILASRTITVQAATSTAQPTKLPNTGARIDDMVRAAILLLVLGAALIAAGRRRRSSPAS